MENKLHDSTDFTFIEDLQIGRTTKISRYIRKKDNRKVLIKSPNNEHPSNEQIASLQHEYNLLKQLSLPGLIHAYDSIQAGLIPILVLENVEGIPLSSFLKAKPLTLEQFFKIAIQLTDIITDLHQHEIIHKDINPANIIVDPVSLKIKLADLSLSTQLTHEVHEQTNPDSLEGTLAYMSPEQTGRMNRPLDYRTDFYSLGITFFEMLTGSLPYQSNDPLELIYCHIAKPAVDVRKLNADVPGMIAAIVAKLMAKEPDERYIHALNLKADLELCAREWKTRHSIGEFILGKNDIEDRLLFSHTLYGRNKQISELQNVFAKVSQGTSELMLVAGYSGIGKTSLIKELQKPITREKGYFISGKFDQLQRTTPYTAFVTAFGDLIKQVLTQSEEKLNLLKQEILTAVGNNGQVIIDMIPEVKLLIGPQPTVPNLSPVESQNRFKFVFHRFVQVFAQKQHPLVIFLDDLQWADSASLVLIENLLLDYQTNYLLIIGAYRDNEVDIHHQLLKHINKLKEGHVPIHEMTLKPLELNDIEHLVNDVFNVKAEKTSKLAKLLLSKTQGNPLFISEFLKQLYKEKLITFSYERHEWIWDLNKIEQQNITDNVVDLLVGKIRQLPDTTQHTLTLAACLGDRFDLQSLSLVAKKDLSETAKSLWEAIEANFIIPMENSVLTETLGNKASLSANLRNELLTYRFTHDRIQQAAYSLITEENRKEIHLKIGRMLLKKSPLIASDPHLFDVLGHLNKGLLLITDPKEKDELSTYNLFAGQKAKAATAYQAAMVYFDIALALLPKDSWELNYNLTLEIYKNYVDTLYFIGDFDKADQLFNIMLQEAHTPLEKANLYIGKISAYSALTKFKEAYTFATEALKLLDFNLIQRATKFTVLKEALLIHYRIGRQKITELDKKMKRASDPKVITTTKILNHILLTALLIDSNLMGYVICKIINISLTKGYSEDTSTAYFFYASLMISAFNKIPLAAQFISLGNKLETESYSAEVASRNHFLKAFLLLHWYNRASANIDYLEETYQKCMEIGNLEYASYTITIDYTYYHISLALPELLKKFDKSLDYLKRTKAADTIRHDEFQVKILRYLYNGEITTPQEFAQLQADMAGDSIALVAGNYHDYSEFLFIINDYPRAFDNARKFFKLKSLLSSHIAYPFGVLFYGLTLAAQYPNATYTDQRWYMKGLLSIQKQMEYWGKNCPSNFLFMFYWISAEISRINNNILEATDFYDKAISAAVNNGYINYSAIINECAFRFFLSLKFEAAAKTYFQNAYYAYQRWGANYKCQLLAQEFPQWIETSIASKGAHVSKELDFTSVMKSSLALSTEIHLDKLLQKLLLISLENTGAQKGALLFEQQHQLLVVAEADNEKNIIINVHGIPLEQHTDLPKTILTYLQHTRQTLLLNDPMEIEKFQRDDPYLQRNNPKSIFCVPILNQGRTIGYIYLENRLTSHAFTDERLEVLRLLAGQTSIALENARLFTATRRFVPYQFLQQINRKNLIEVRLGDQIQIQMSVLFCDIRNFTSISEKLSADQVFNLINKFLGYMEPVIKKNNGFIDKYIGDAIMALFEQPDDAVKAGLKIMETLGRFNHHEKDRYPEIKIGIGINTGNLMMGIIGSRNRMEGTVIGDAVNVASRIQELTKKYNHPLLISDATRILLGPSVFTLTEVGEIQMRGKEKPVTIWSVEPKEPGNKVE